MTQHTQVAVGNTEMCEQVPQSGMLEEGCMGEVARDLESAKPRSREEAVPGHMELGKEA